MPLNNLFQANKQKTERSNVNDGTLGLVCLVY